MIAIFAALSVATTLPTKSHVDDLRQNTRDIITDMLNASVGHRLQYHCNGGRLSKTQQTELCKLAKTASSKLSSIHRKQQAITKQIEDYAGDDWDKLFGKTRLWRKASADVGTTLLYKTEADFWTAIACIQPRPGAELKDIIKKCGSNTPSANLMAARAYAGLASIDPAAKQKAIELLNRIFLSSAVEPSILFRAEALKFEIESDPDPKLIKDVYASLNKSAFADDFELNVRLAMSLLRSRDNSILEKTLDKWPATEPFIGNIVLAGLSKEYADNTLTKETLCKKTPLEITLAVTATKDKHYRDYEKVLMMILTCKKFQTPTIIFFIAQAQQQFAPEDAVENYLLAAEIRKQPIPAISSQPPQISHAMQLCSCANFTNRKKYPGNIL